MGQDREKRFWPKVFSVAANVFWTALSSRALAKTSLNAAPGSSLACFLLRTLRVRVSRENTSYLHLRLTHPRDPLTPPHSLRPPHHAKNARVGDPGCAHSEFAQDDNAGSAFKQARALYVRNLFMLTPRSAQNHYFVILARGAGVGLDRVLQSRTHPPQAASLRPD